MATQDDRLLQEWANGYVEEYGRALIQEQRMFDEQNIRYATPRADARIKQLTKAPKKPSRAPILAAAAALLVVFVGVAAVFAQFGPQALDLFAPTQSGNIANDRPSTGDVGTDPVHPLNFTLPVRFSVASVEADRGETIYHLDNSLHDDAVMTISASAGNNAWMNEMDAVSIDGTTVAAKLHDEYKLLSFEKDGLLYTLSCRDDLETLSTLYRSITA